MRADQVKARNNPSVTPTPKTLSTSRSSSSTMASVKPSTREPTPVSETKVHEFQSTCYRCGKQGHYKPDCPTGLVTEDKVIKVQEVDQEQDSGSEQESGKE